MDHFYKLTNIGVAIIDIKGNILVATGWQEICTKFHRAHPETLINCIESDTVLSAGTEPGSYKLYRCKNNMWDIATPITVGGKHLGNLFLGQFLFEDEAVDYSFFRSQAHRYGFNEEEYLAALERVPRWSRETINNAMNFYTRLARLFSRLGMDIVERRQVEEALQQQLRFEKMVSEITAQFATITAEGVDEVINQALQLSGRFFDADRSYVVLFSDDGSRAYNTHEWCDQGIEPQMDKVQGLPTVQMAWGMGKLGRFETINIPRVKEMPPEAAAEKKIMQDQSIQSVLIAPMVSMNRLIGFIGFDAVRSEKNWQDEQVSLVKILAEMIANAVERKRFEKKIARYTMELEFKSLELEELYRKLDEELDKARQVHEKTLLEKLPEVEGLSLAAHYHPAKKLGGDFYDVIKTGSKLIIYLSDVTGHGLDGAMMSIFVKNTINSFVSLVPIEMVSPSGIAKFLSWQYHRENYPDDYFIGIFLAVLNLKTLQLSYTGAGFQNAPLACLGNGEQVELASRGLPITSAVPYYLLDFQESSVNLTPGSTVLFNTDGLAEQSLNEKIYNYRLAKIFYASSHLPPEIILRTINEDFRSFNNNSLQGDDDITFLVMQVEPENNKKWIFVLESSFEELTPLRRQVREFLPGFEKKELFIACLHELVVNAIEHGNRFDRAKKVSVEIVITDHDVVATVEDEGEGFNWSTKMDVPIELEGNRERGRGIALTNISCKNLFYNEKGNRASIIWELKKHPGSLPVCKLTEGK